MLLSDEAERLDIIDVQVIEYLETIKDYSATRHVLPKNVCKSIY